MKICSIGCSYFIWATVLIILNLGVINLVNSQCDPSTIDLCEIGNNSIIQAVYHAQIAKTSNGYSITGEDFAPDGISYSTVLTNIPSSAYPMPSDVAPVWGAIGGRTQAVFVGTDSRIYAVGEEDLLIDQSKTNGPRWGLTNMNLPPGITVCDINKWQGTAGSGSDNNNNANVTGDRDGFLAFSTITGEMYITGDGASAIQSQSSNTDWTLINMPPGISVVNFGVGYRTLLILGNDGNLYASGPDTYLGDGTYKDIDRITLLEIQPDISVFGISQIEAGYNSYFILDGDGTVHVLGENSEGALGVGNISDITSWSKVGMNCPGGILREVAYISTMSTHDNRISSSVILIDRTIKSWGSNSRQSITTGEEMLIPCPIIPTGNNRNAVAISNGGHISPYVNVHTQICNIGHNRQGAFGDGNDEQGDYGEYNCRIIPGNPEICGTKEADLSLEKTVSDMNPKTGEEIIFTITVRNNGPEASTGSYVRDQLTSAFYYLRDDSNGGYNRTTGLWIVGPLDVGESKSIRITVIALESGPQTNYAQIIVDNEVDLNSTPGDNSRAEDDDDLVQLNVILCPKKTSDELLCPDDSIYIGNNWIHESGIYLESIPIAFGCDSLHITNVQYEEDAPIPHVEVDCEALEYILNVPTSSIWNPTWDNGDTFYQTIYDSATEMVNLSLETSSNCLSSIDVTLPPLATSEAIPIFQDTTILESSLLELNVNLDTQEWRVLWMPESIVECVSCMMGKIIATESTEVTLFLEHISGCTFESSFSLNIEKLPEHIYASNIFAPSSHSGNKEWTISTTPNILIEECKIYNRWGNLVYNSKSEIPKWDGTFKGKECAQGVYIYVINYKDSDNMNQTLSGDVTLIR